MAGQAQLTARILADEARTRELKFRRGIDVGVVCTQASWQAPAWWQLSQTSGSCLRLPGSPQPARPAADDGRRRHLTGVLVEVAVAAMGGLHAQSGG